jgi:hypothetical protein
MLYSSKEIIGFDLSKIISFYEEQFETFLQRFSDEIRLDRL